MMLGALLLSGVVEGVSLTTLLPLVNVATGKQGSAGGETATEVVTDGLAVLGLSPTLELLLVIIVIGMVMKGGLKLLAERQVGYTVARVATDLRLDLIRALLRSRWEYYLSRPVGGLANAVATEANRGSSAYLYGARAISLLLEAGVYTGVALLVAWRATLAFLFGGAVLLYLLNRLLRMARRAGARQTALLQSLLSRLTDTLYSVKSLKAMAREELADTLLAGDTTRLNRALHKQVFSKAALTAVQEPLLAVLLAGGLYLGLRYWQVSLPAMLMLVFLLGRVLARLSKVQRQYQQMATCESAFWSLRETIEEAQQHAESPSGRLSPSLESGLHLHRVSFAYRHQWILRDISLTLPPSSFTAILGPSGAGKTTIVDLVTGLLQPQYGEVQVDGYPLQDYDRRLWRRMIGYVPQETVLLNDTVANNVALGDPGLDEEDIRRALVAAGAWAFVAVLPEGIHAPVGERGAHLSGGQRQRLMIARALAHRPRLLILDEATSALDAEGEQELCRTLETLAGQLSILAISHRPALAQVAEQVYQLQGGRLTSVATPTELHNPAILGSR